MTRPGEMWRWRGFPQMDDGVRPFKRWFFQRFEPELQRQYYYVPSFVYIDVDELFVILWTHDEGPVQVDPPKTRNHQWYVALLKGDLVWIRGVELEACELVQQ